MEIWGLASFLALHFICCKATGQELKTPSDEPKLLLISVGGFRGDYLKTTDCPNLRHFVANGTAVSYVQNSINIASVTNHYSIATGLYPESHGIVADTMYDPQLKRVFDSKTRAQAEWWLDVHPIWQEIERQGKGLSALCRWPGVYGPLVPTLQCSDEEGKSLKDDIDQAIRWLKNDVKLVLLYSDEIKKAALRWGPHSQQAINEVRKFDSTLKYLLNQTRDLNVNILLTSDSGVTDLHWDRGIDLDQCIDPKSYILTQPQGTLLIYPKHGYTLEDIYKNLTKCSHIRVYLKESLPEHFHFAHHRRIPPIIAFVPLGSVVHSSKVVHKTTNAILRGSSVLHRDMGGNGYHPGYEVMRGVFFANGPSFQSGRKYGAIDNTDLYGLMCSLLGVDPHPSNVSFDVVKSMLKGPELAAKMDTSPTSVNQQRNTTKRPVKIISYSRSNGLLGDLELRGFLIFMGCSIGLMALFCCIGCANSMRKNAKGGFKKKTSVHAPLLNTYLTSSSDEDDDND